MKNCCLLLCPLGSRNSDLESLQVEEQLPSPFGRAMRENGGKEGDWGVKVRAIS